MSNKDLLENLDAPTWTDFTKDSPQINLDEYFDARSKSLLSTQYRDNRVEDSPKIFCEKVKNLDLNKSEFDSSYENLCNDSSKSNVNKKKKRNGEIQYESALTEAMNNLKLGQLKYTEIRNNKEHVPCFVDSPVCKTPHRVTRSLCLKINKTITENNLTINELIMTESNSKGTNTDSQTDLEEPLQTSNKSSQIDDTLIITDDMNLPSDLGSQVVTQNSTNSKQIATQDTLVLNSELQLPSNLEECTVEIVKSIKKSKIVTSFKNNELNKHNIQKNIKGKNLDAKKNIGEKICNNKINKHFDKKNVANNTKSKNEAPEKPQLNLLKKKQPSVLTGNAWHREVKRRISIINHKAQRRNKFETLAEGIQKYEETVPDRFKKLPMRTETLRRMSLKLTRAISPALTSKNRARPTKILCREEREKKELEEIRKNKIKANPVPKFSQNNKAIKTFVKKITVPEPFNLTDSKKYKHSHDEEIKRTHWLPKVTVPKIVVSDENNICIKDEEVLYFGIPIDSIKNKKKQTKIKPFSFEERNKKLLLKKEEKMKALKEEEKNKIKAEFHARPIPNTLKTPALKPTEKKIPLSYPQSKKPNVTRKLSLRNNHQNEQMKQKEQNLKPETRTKIFEEEKLNRVFKAQPVPTFKPVIVKGRLRDMNNKKISDTNSKSSTTNSIDSSKTAQKVPIVKKKQFPMKTMNREKKNLIPEVHEKKTIEPIQKNKAILSELNTDKRAKERQEFDNKIKKKELEGEERKRNDEKENLKREMNVRNELRKQAETKANPMPTFKPIKTIIQSNKVTVPESPSLGKKREKH